MPLHHEESSEGNIRFAFFLNLTFAAAEFAGGFLLGSLAITADALHDLGDAFSLGLAWFFERVSGKGPTALFSYGYRRFSLVAAFANGVVLVTGAVLVLRAAIPRLLAPVMPDARGMLLFAVAGILVNGAAALRLKKAHTMNERMVAWHLVEDLLGWAAILFVSIVLLGWEVPVLDPVVSILITLIVLVNVLRNLRHTVVIFLQGVPPSISLQGVGDELRSVPGVMDVHDLHLWSLDGEHHILTAHVVIPRGSSAAESMAVKCRVREAATALGITHATIEMEQAGEACGLEECTGGICREGGPGS